MANSTLTKPEMLTFHQCAKCGTLDAACINTCAKCLSSSMNPVQIAGVGKLVSWTAVRKPPLRFKADGMYHVGVFDLDNGFRVTGRFLPEDGDQLGDRVVAVPTTVTESTGLGTPTFRVQKNV
jgi:uncharacterized OB-fold protein